MICMSVYSREITSMFFAGQVSDSELVRTFNTWDVLRRHKCDNRQSLHDGTSHWVLPVQTTFSEPDHISRTQKRWRHVSEHVVFLLVKNTTCSDTSLQHFCEVKLCGTVKKSQEINDYTTIFHFSSYSREMIDMFSDLIKKSLMLAFWQVPFKGGLSNLAWLRPCLRSSNSYQI